MLFSNKKLNWENNLCYALWRKGQGSLHLSSFVHIARIISHYQAFTALYCHHVLRVNQKYESIPNMLVREISNLESN